MNNLSPLDLKTLEEHHIKLTKRLVRKLNKGYPLQYIIGNVDFYHDNFIISKDVLIPRFETEYLVDYILKEKETYSHILDLCTGSGVIGISLAKYLKADGTLVDISKKALKVAEKNILLHNVPLTILKKDVLKYQIPDLYDLIVINPPYLDQDDLVDKSTKYEPKKALYSNKDKNLFYKKVIEQLPNLSKWQLVAFEIGENSSAAITDYLKLYQLNNYEVKKDLNNKDRYIFIRR